MIESLKSQLVKFKQMYESMKNLVNIISETEKELKETVGEDIKQLDDSTANIYTAAAELISITDTLSETLKQRTREDFKRFDVDGDGHWNEQEFLAAMGVKIDTDDIDASGDVTLRSFSSDHGEPPLLNDYDDSLMRVIEISTSPESDESY